MLGVKFVWIHFIFSSNYLKACLDKLNVAVPKFREDSSAFLDPERAVVTRATQGSCWILDYI